MGKLSSIITMVELLSTNRKYSIGELSKELEVTPRMIRFYKEELEKAGIYIETIRGPYGGYVLNHGAWIPSRGFSKYDIQLLEYSYKVINDNDEFKLQKEYLNLIDKVKGIYHGSKKKNELNKLEMNKDEKKKYNILNRAIKEKRKVLINFLSADGTDNERIIHPCDMFYYDNSWYISAFCELRNEIRHFRLERILSYKLLDEKYI